MFSTLILFGTLIYVLFGFATIILWLVALISILKNDFKDTATKILWIVLVLVLPVLGAVLYLIIGRKQIITKVSQE